MRTQRSIAQPGRALRSGRRGRGFEPRYSDQIIFSIQYSWEIFLLQYILTNKLKKNKDCEKLVQDYRSAVKVLEMNRRIKKVK